MPAARPRSWSTTSIRSLRRALTLGDFVFGYFGAAWRLARSMPGQRTVQVPGGASCSAPPASRFLLPSRSILKLQTPAAGFRKACVKEQRLLKKAGPSHQNVAKVRDKLPRKQR
jgi:hypothetical protein